jgi:hypothetical protein
LVVGFNDKRTTTVVYFETVSCFLCAVGGLHFLSHPAAYCTTNPAATVEETETLVPCTSSSPFTV